MSMASMPGEDDGTSGVVATSVSSGVSIGGVKSRPYSS